jgi:cysteine desulfurase
VDQGPDLVENHAAGEVAGDRREDVAPVEDGRNLETKEPGVREGADRGTRVLLEHEAEDPVVGTDKVVPGGGRGQTPARRAHSRIDHGQEHRAPREGSVDGFEGKGAGHDVVRGQFVDHVHEGRSRAGGEHRALHGSDVVVLRTEITQERDDRRHEAAIVAETRHAAGTGYDDRAVHRIYLDNNATTPLDPRVLEAMTPALEAHFGNPSSAHWYGQQARRLLDDARDQVAGLLGAATAEIVFTGSGTEADNLALRGAAQGAPASRRRIVVTSIEHHAVLHVAQSMAREGWAIEVVRTLPDGSIDLEDLRVKVNEEAALLSLMLANNETGVIQPVAEAAAHAHERGAIVHCDAVQAVGKIPVDVRSLGVDLLSISAHKLYGPKGVGALYVRRGTSLEALLRGGSQERNRRAGTENVAGIVGLGTAAALCRTELPVDALRMARQRDALERALLEIPGARRNGLGERVPNTSNIRFAGVDAESLLLALDLEGIAVSAGAACSAGGIEPSHVLTAMGLSMEEVQSSLRFSLGRQSRDSDVERTAATVAECVTRQKRAFAGR